VLGKDYIVITVAISVEVYPKSYWREVASMVLVIAALERCFVAGILIWFAGMSAAQATYPTKPVRLISPYAPGGTNNTVARLLSQNLGERWG